MSDQAATIEVSTGVGPQLLREQLPRALQQPGAIGAAKDAMDQYGFGSLGAIHLGTQDQHKRLEDAVSTFLGTEDTILYTRPLTPTPVSSRYPGARGRHHLRRAQPRPIIDGICAGQADALRHMDMEDLEAKLKEAQQPGVPRS